jgi:CRP-like cAMP-binding protein
MAERRSRSGSPAIGDLTVEQAVTANLERIAERDERLAQSPLAAMALELARQLDADRSATSKALVSKELRELLASLEVLAPAEKPKDGIDDLNERRRRKSRASG